VERGAAGEAPWLEPVYDMEVVEEGQSSLCSAKRVEADVGNLGRGQYPMVVEKTADHPVSFGDVTRQLEEALFPCTP
jgi:hypothetical protein